jgi:hypothetical protein
MYRFVKEHKDEIKDRDYGFKHYDDMLKCIKENWTDAAWALTELCWWGMNTDYSKEFEVAQLDDEYETRVYCIIDSNGDNRYFSFEYKDMWFSNIAEMIPTTKIVETYMPIK